MAWFLEECIGVATSIGGGLTALSRIPVEQVLVDKTVLSQMSNLTGVNLIEMTNDLGEVIGYAAMGSSNLNGTTQVGNVILNLTKEATYVDQAMIDAAIPLLEGGTTADLAIGTELSTIGAETALIDGAAVGVGTTTLSTVAGVAGAIGLGVAGGVALYNIVPEFWNGVADKLYDAGATIGGKVLTFFNLETGETYYDTKTMEIIHDMLDENEYFIDDATIIKYDTPSAEHDYTKYKLNKMPLSQYTEAYMQCLPDISVTPYMNIRNKYKEVYEGLFGSTNLWNSENPSISLALGTDNYIYAIALNYTYWHYYFDWWSVNYTICAFPNNQSFVMQRSGNSVTFNFDNPTNAVVLTRQVGNPYTRHESYNLHENVTSVGISNVVNGVGYDGRTDRPYIPGLFVPEDEQYGGTDYYSNISIPKSVDKGVNYTDSVDLTTNYPEITPHTYTITPIKTNVTDPIADPDADYNPYVTPEEVKDYVPSPTEDPIIDPDPDPDTDNEPEPSPNPQPNEVVDTGYPDPPDPNDPDNDDGVENNLPFLPDIDRSRIANIYNPTLSEVNSLGDYLWSATNLIDILKIFQNPMDGIVSLHKVFCKPTTSGSAEIFLGYLPTNVNSKIVVSQLTTVNCGSLEIPIDKQNALDYSPYTNVEIYLPFIGFRTLNAYEVVGKTIAVNYRIDVYTGACVAQIIVNNGENFNAVLYEFSGNCAVQIPLTSSNMMQYVANFATSVGSQFVNGANPVQGAFNIVNNVIHDSLNIQRTGNLSSNYGMLGNRKPYVVIRRFNSYDAYKYNSFYGYPSNKTVFLYNCKGFTKVKDIILNCSGTDEEKDEIVRLLKDGIYI